MGLKYYKKDGKSTWVLADEHNPPGGMVFETVLAMETNPEQLENQLDQKYFGPFYIDIDSEDLEEALHQAKVIVKYMVTGYSLNPETDLRIFATGKKGFHIELNPFVFMDNKFKQLLPYRYKLMAAGIGRATGMTLDMVVYSGKKGRMWRLPNVQRDNGKYKILLNYANFLMEDYAYFENLMAKPGPAVLPFKKVHKNPLAESWFKASEIPVNQGKKLVDTGVLESIDVPDCISRLKNLDHINSQARFNGLVLNAATYGARKGWSVNEALEYFKPMLNYSSSVYKSMDDKIDHFKNVYSFVKENEDYKFDCGFICKIVDEPKCLSCPVKLGDDVEAKDVDTDNGIIVKGGCYHLINVEGGTRKLTGFIMEILHDVVMPNGEVFYELLLTNVRGRKRTITVPENVFSTKNTLNKYLSPDFPVWGSERELMMISWYLRRHDPKEQIGKDFIGLHWADKEWHYANDHGSISLNGTVDKIKVNAKSLTIVNSNLDYSWPDINKDDVEKIVDSLLKFNMPQVVIPAVGWFLSAFFKPHYDEAFSQFPLLFLFGEAGAGKTSTGLILRRLFAMNDMALKSIADVTQFSLMAACNSSNLIPLILDEYKPMMMKETQAQLVSRLIRGAYNSSRGERGTATQEIIPYYYRAPIMLLGEQSIIETAVQHRVFEVQLTRSYLSANPSAKQYLESLGQLPLESFGKAFLSFAMSFKPKDIKALVDIRLQRFTDDLKLPERPTFNHTVLSVTFELLKEFVSQYGLNLTKIIDETFANYEQYIKNGNGLIDTLLNKNDVIKILDIINLLGDMSSSPYPIIQNVHYQSQDNRLYLDVETTFPLFSKYNRDYHLGLYDMGLASFIKMLQKESFCVSISRTTNINKRQKLTACLDLKQCKSYNVNLSNLVTGYID